MSDDFRPMTVTEYAAEAATTDQRSDGASLSFPLLGLFGETGSLLSEVKKKQRKEAYTARARSSLSQWVDAFEMN